MYQSIPSVTIPLGNFLMGEFPTTRAKRISKPSSPGPYKWAKTPHKGHFPQLFTIEPWKMRQMVGLGIHWYIIRYIFFFFPVRMFVLSYSFCRCCCIICNFLPPYKPPVDKSSGRYRHQKSLMNSDKLKAHRQRNMVHALSCGFTVYGAHIWFIDCFDE